jgi:protein-tyrosine phosphatase
MNQITPQPLWLGHAGAVADFRRVFDAGIKALVQLATEELPDQPPRELIYCRIPLVDGTGNRAELLYLAISTVATLVKMRIPTLVYCGAGMSRAPAIAAAALGMVHQEPPEEWLNRVARHHHTDVSPGLWREITGLLPSVR